VLPVPVRANSVAGAICNAFGALAVMAWHAVRLTLLALLITLEPVVRLGLTLLTVLLFASAVLFATVGRDAGPAPLALAAAACGCALGLLGWYGAIAALHGRRRG
jgi:hypothetical protein